MHIYLNSECCIIRRVLAMGTSIINILNRKITQYLFNSLMIIFLSSLIKKLLYSKMIIKHLCYPERKKINKCERGGAHWYLFQFTICNVWNCDIVEHLIMGFPQPIIFDSKEFNVYRIL